MKAQGTSLPALRLGLSTPRRQVGLAPAWSALGPGFCWTRFCSCRLPSACRAFGNVYYTGRNEGVSSYDTRSLALGGGGTIRTSVSGL